MKQRAHWVLAMENNTNGITFSGVIELLYVLFKQALCIYINCYVFLISLESRYFATIVYRLKYWRMWATGCVGREVGWYKEKAWVQFHSVRLVHMHGTDLKGRVASLWCHDYSIIHQLRHLCQFLILSYFFGFCLSAIHFITYMVCGVTQSELCGCVIKYSLWPCDEHLN